jgi:hypothetical protein
MTSAAETSIQLGRVAVSGVLSYALHKVGAMTLGRLGPATLRKGERLYLAELVPSTVHALLMAGAATYFVSSDLWKADMVEPYDERLSWVFAFSAGYSIHDSIVCALHGEHFTMYAYHIVMAIGATGMSLYKRTALVPIFFYLSEWSVPVQNALYLAEKTQASPVVVRALLILRMVMFLLFRTAQLPSFAFLLHSRGFSFFDAMSKVHVGIAGLTVANVLLLTALNSVWTLALLRRTLPLLRAVKNKH